MSDGGQVKDVAWVNGWNHLMVYATAIKDIASLSKKATSVLRTLLNAHCRDNASERFAYL